MNSDFLSPSCTPEKLDIFVIRRAILRALKAELSRFEGVMLDVGCGDMPYKSLVTSPPGRVERYIGLDLDQRRDLGSRPDITWQDGTIPLEDGSVDCALSTEVFEHCPEPEAVMREIFRVLKPGGLLFFTVPFLWPLHEQPHDYYRFTPYSLERHLAASGFTDIRLSPTGGWDASLAQVLGLWARRRPMKRWRRSLASILLQPVVHALLRTDARNNITFDDSPMITGITGTARKSPVDAQE